MSVSARSRRRLCTRDLALMFAPLLMGTVPLAVQPEQTEAAAPRSAAIETNTELPEPTGPLAVGMSNLRIPLPNDTEVGVALWYPTVDNTGRDAVYVTAEQSRELVAALLGSQTTTSPDILSTTHTHATADPEPLAADVPLVVALAGLNLPGTSMGGLALDLASHGYAVATVDWADDMTAAASAVLDELIRGDSIRIDPDKVAVIGHSYGGEAAARLVRADSRFVAGISFDSTFPPDITTDVEVPFMMLDTPIHANSAHSSNWQHLTGWRRWYIVQGSTHYTFTDYPVLFEQVGIMGFEGSTTARARESVVVRSYVGAFLDLHLLGTPEPLLDPPLFSEVIFQDPPQQP